MLILLSELVGCSRSYYQARKVSHEIAGARKCFGWAARFKEEFWTWR